VSTLPVCTPILCLTCALSNRRGEEIGAKDIGQAAKELEKNMDKMSLDEGEDDDDAGDGEDDTPIFTAELAKMKAQALGQEFTETEDADEDMGDEEEIDTRENNKNRDKYADEFSDSEEEKEDYTIRRTDSIIVTATAENDHSNLEVYIYEHEKSNLYVHHELILGAYPLCLEWLPSWQGTKANLMVVGTFLPEIEIWNLDTEDCDPVAILGSLDLSEQAKSTSVAKKYKKQNPELTSFSEQTHTDAVMSLSLNPYQMEYLASGSADKTVRIWDIDELAVKATYASLHSDKVQAVRWNRLNEQILLTGGYDGKLNVVDVRDSDSALTY